MPDRYTEAKDFLLANMYEEEIGGDRHTDLLIRFAEACGTTRERVSDPDNMTATTRGLQSWCYAVAMREDPIVAVAGLVVGLESQVPSIYRKQTPTLREKYKFTDEEVEFFDLHIVSDEIHGERGYQIVLEHANTVELQQRCLKICEVGAQMRLLYTTALYHDYVAQDIPLSRTRTAPSARSREDERAIAPGVIKCRPSSFIAMARPIRARLTENTNLVVRAGIKQFPFPHLRYGCGMGKCAKCACRDHRRAPSTCRRRTGRKRNGSVPGSDEGYRLVCQLWLNHDVELAQDKNPIEPLASAP